ncbi:MAG: membrane protein insertase YidC, partial [Planctomycetes bacterium]|nr:membrane protein insertase YidC [Planctomycetota bacterium]
MAKAQPNKKSGKESAKARSYAPMAGVTLLCIILIFWTLRTQLFDSTEKQQPDTDTSSESSDSDPEKKTETKPDLKDEGAKPEVVKGDKKYPALAVDNAPITPEDFKTVSVGSVKDGKGLTVVFNRRGGVVSVVRFTEESGDKRAPIYVRTPRSPMDAPKKDDAEEAMLLLGPVKSLRPWKWNQASGSYIPKTFEEDAFTAYPESVSGAAFDSIWNREVTINGETKLQRLEQAAAFQLLGEEVLNSQTWAWKSGPTTLEDGSATLALEAFHDDLQVVKNFRIYPDFKITCELELTNHAASSIERSIHVMGPAGVRQDLRESTTANVTALFANQSANSYEREELHFVSLRSRRESYVEEFDKAQTTAAIPSSYDFDREPEARENLVLNGISNGYFLAAIGIDYVPAARYGDGWSGRVGGDVVLSAFQVAEKDDEPNIHATLSFPKVTLEAGQSVNRRVALYAGPRDKAHVKLAFIGGLDEGGKIDGALIGDNASWSDYLSTGWPEIISGPITWLLDALQSGIGSMGLAIICLTLIVRFTMSPLSWRAQKSMQIHAHKMRGIKPKLDEIRAKYKENKSRDGQMLQFQETRAVMKANNVSLFPLGGCLPVLLQFPIFLALYNSVRTSFLLRHESFLWIRDLSRPDSLAGAWESGFWLISQGGFVTLNLLPILWSLLLVVQQSGQAPPTDPQ